MTFSRLILLLIFSLILQQFGFAEGVTRGTEVPVERLSRSVREIVTRLRHRTADESYLPKGFLAPVVARKIYIADLPPNDPETASAVSPFMYLYSIDLDIEGNPVRVVAQIPNSRLGLVSAPIFSPATSNMAFVVRQASADSRIRHPLSDPEAMTSFFALVSITSGATSVVENVGNRIGPDGKSFSPDGKRIAFYASVPAGGLSDMCATVARQVAEQGLPWSHLRILDIESGVSRQVSPGIPEWIYGSTPKWSPGGRLLAVPLPQKGKSGETEYAVRIIDTETTHMITLPRLNQDTTLYGNVEWIDEDSLLIASRQGIYRYNFKSESYSLLVGGIHASDIDRAPVGNVYRVRGQRTRQGAAADPETYFRLDLEPSPTLHEDPLDAAAPGSPWAYPAIK